MITDKQLDIIFDKDILDQPELSSWASDLTGSEHEDAKRLFRAAVRKAIAMDAAGKERVQSTNEALEDAMGADSDGF